jgi:RND family efflux transporter MFP subunit
MRHYTPFLLACVVAAGCSHPQEEAKPAHARPEVRLTQPQRRTIVRVVGQPAFIEAYEQTAMYPKVAGFIDEWKVDIGDTLKKGQLLCQIFVPELQAEYQEKKAQVVLDEERIHVAEEQSNVARHNWKAAGARVQEAQANVGKYEADIARWQSEVNRLTRMAKERVVDQQILDEMRKQLKASTAARAAAQAAAVSAQANESARLADVSKAEADVRAARARLKVAQATEQRLAALVGYTHITAPYDGVVVVRNVNTGDYVEPARGDPSAPRPAPLYVVARTDVVRVFVDVPEMEAHGVQRGSKAWVRIQALNDEEFPAAVTRTSWALAAQTRTLRAEIDLPNPGGRILPNMYAYGRVELKRPNVWALPLGAVTEIGNHNCCFLSEDGKACQVPVQLGINDGKWVEVAKKRAHGNWTAFTGDEQVILGDLTEISDGELVRVAPPAKPK